MVMVTDVSGQYGPLVLGRWIENFMFWQTPVLQFSFVRSGILTISSSGSKISFFEVCQLPESYFQNFEF